MAQCILFWRWFTSKTYFLHLPHVIASGRPGNHVSVAPEALGRLVHENNTILTEEREMMDARIVRLEAALMKKGIKATRGMK